MTSGIKLPVLCESSFLLSLDLLETLDLFSDTRSFDLCEREDVSDLVGCKDPLPAAGKDEGSKLIL